MRRLFFLLSGPVFLFLTVCGAGAGELSGAQTEALVRLAFEHQVAHIRHGRAYSLDWYRKGYDPGYTWIEVWGIWHDPSEAGSIVLGRYSVNEQTAEVWNTYAECFRVRFPALQKLQQRLLREADISPQRKAPPDHSRPRLC